MKHKKLLFFYVLVLLMFTYSGSITAQNIYEVNDGSVSSLLNAIELANNDENAKVYIKSPDGNPVKFILTDQVEIKNSMIIEGECVDNTSLITIQVENVGVTPHRLFLVIGKSGMELTFSNITLLGGDILESMDGDTQGGIFSLDNEEYWDDQESPMATLYLKNVVIAEAKASLGGALFVGGGWNLHITNTKMEKNFSDYGGGAIHLNEGNVNITDSEFSENISFGSGGALTICNDYEEVLSISNTKFKSNATLGYGGALYSCAGTYSLSGCEFVENTAGHISPDYGRGASGGAIYFSMYSFQTEDFLEANIESCTFRTNKSKGNGGAISGYASNIPVAIKNVIFVDNEAVDLGGALSIEAGTVVLDQSTFINNYLIAQNSGTIPYSTPDRKYPSEHKGGAAYLSVFGCEDCEDDKIRIVDSSFEGNGIKGEDDSIEAFGGALYLFTYGKKSEVINTDFKNNYIELKGADCTGSGGALSSFCIHTSLIGSYEDYMLFSGNYVKVNDFTAGCCGSGGGAISILDGKLSTRYNLFDSNYIDLYSDDSELEMVGGGAICSSNAKYESFKSTFTRNYARIENPILVNCGGGAIYASSRVEILESTMANNYVELKGNSCITNSGGGAFLSGCCVEHLGIMNSTIVRNYANIIGDNKENSAGGGICLVDHANAQIMNSIILGNHIGDNKDIEDSANDIYVGEDLEDPCIDRHLKMAYTIYAKVNAPQWVDVSNTVSDIENVFAGEPILNKNVIKISEMGKAASEGTFVGFIEGDDDCGDCLKYNYFFRQDGFWNEFKEFIEDDSSPTISQVAAFEEQNTTGNYGLQVERQIGASEEETGIYEGKIFRMAQNDVERDFTHSYYNAGAYALKPRGPEPEKGYDAWLQWSVSITTTEEFADVENNTTTTVTEPTPVYLQIRPVVEGGLDFDEWAITYSTSAESNQYSSSGNISNGKRYNFKSGEPHVLPGTYNYEVIELRLYKNGVLMDFYNFGKTAYTHTIIINKKDEPVPNPDPVPAISIEGVSPFCYTEQTFRLMFELLEKGLDLEYKIVYSDGAKSAGFKDMPEYVKLPQSQNYIDIAVSNRIAKGLYTGTVHLRHSGELLIIEKYEFEVAVMEETEIVMEPEYVNGKCTGDGFTLSVEATGDELRYQWYYNDKKIPGANEAIYQNVLSESTTGEYYVEVIGFCNLKKSRKVRVSQSSLAILMKWDDVMYVQNTDNRFLKFQWYKNGQPILQHGNSIYYTDPEGLNGNYSVRAYTSDGIFEESCVVSFGSKTKVSSVIIYPNPVKRNNPLTIETAGPDESYLGARIDIYDLNGKKVNSLQLKSERMEIPINVSAGMYVLQITYSSGKMITKKIIVN